MGAAVVAEREGPSGKRELQVSGDARKYGLGGSSSIRVRERDESSARHRAGRVCHMQN